MKQSQRHKRGRVAESCLGDKLIERETVASQSRRAVYVDRARGAVIAIVLFSHAMNIVEGWATDAPNGVWGILALVIRTGTPTFFVVFGIAVEIVHVHRWRNGDAVKVRRALLKRALQCYIAFAIVAVAAMLGGLTSLPDMLAGLVLAVEVPNGTVLSFYALALVACLALIPLRLKIGTLPTLAITVAWWPVSAALESTFATPSEAPFALARLFGIGDGVGPSVAHGLSLVAGGMVLGRLVRAILDGAATKRAITEPAVVVSAALAATFLLAFQLGLQGIFTGYTDLSAFRQTNHWGYFTIGYLLATGILVLAYVIVEKAGFTQHRKPGPFGSSSLLAFGGGNVILNLVATSVTATTAMQAILMSMVFVGAIWFLIKLDRVLRKSGSGPRIRDWRKRTDPEAHGKPAKATVSAK